MRTILYLISLFLITSCVSSPPRYAGGQRIYSPGVSFVPPNVTQWSMLMNSTYQNVLASYGRTPDESFIVATKIVQSSTFTSKEEFLKAVKDQRAAEPQTGRFELISNNEFLDTGRTETCVKHIAASKDFGAKRGGEFTIYETYGMNCIHPNNPTIGVFVELSRKAPPNVPYNEFKSLGEELLQSVKFTEFR